MSPGDLKGKIQTVLGPIAPEMLGRTLMHEHVLCDIRPPGTRSDNDLGPEITLENVWQINYGRGLKRAGRKYMLDLEDIATREVRMMKHQGGDAIVELTCGGLSPDPNGLRRIAAGTGVHLIMGCGYYVNDYQDPRNHARTVDDFAVAARQAILGERLQTIVAKVEATGPKAFVTDLGLLENRFQFRRHIQSLAAKSR